MKKNVTKLIIPCFAAIMSLAGCGENPTPDPTVHTHTYNTTTWKTNSEKHWHGNTCSSVCGQNLAIDVATHADGDNDGLCDVCKYQMVMPHIHTYSTDWTCNETQHWHANDCEAVCGQKLAMNLADHVDGDGDGLCDVCRYKIGQPTPTPTPIEEYYKNYDLELEGPELEQELQKLCFDTHSVYWKYSQYYSAAQFTADHISSEAAPSTVKTTKLNEFFYTGAKKSGVGTREHVWPCANSANLWTHDGTNTDPHYVDGTNYRGGGSDLYHIRPSTSSVNTARGNSKFCDFDDPEFDGIRDGVAEVGESGGLYKLKIQGYTVTKTGGYEFANKAEVDDAYKGDVARILVYVWIHYAYRGNYYDHEDMIGALDLCNVLAYNSDYDRTIEKLCEWNKMDPPSETEKLRNNTVQGLQGNRNPFVDYPELMNRVFCWEE